ncbi:MULTISPECIES: ABC transporter ATP-binding protein [Actinoalloteichus]|uniref:ABC-type nitrate/sulfonate/bicarbonate transport system, ATPase component n=1 Tax=Actinoalloteichus fjordicus TaxID=1612552 RepID=A0AAC9LH63_9PSEU|nr:MULTISPECIES: ABC transporter ATP-binding protein [Actinoalloteichus]APU16815.1 ABC-type nitrate/sulfonate/bicarbonate transport system, ATPase component [Actinoalloteichus fjordicus]APU22880.1 ABC-type nitrate/sulfonate/bicarbonate transport system, ATPase component [Actinoalloteichus sp. GBA129-24]
MTHNAYASPPPSSPDTGRGLLAVRGVSKDYTSLHGETVHALDDVNLTVDEGEIIAIIGPSGCGKSTLLRMLAGLDDDYDGEIVWERPPRPGRDIGFVFQEPALLPWRTVERNVRLGIEVQKERLDRADERVATLLELVGLSGFAKSFPKELSGGMRQRVAIVRALAYDPRILLMDEPFGALDAITRDRLHDDILRIWEETRKTIVFVTHSVEEAAYLADRVVVMSPRPGRLQAVHDVPLDRNRSAATRELPEFARFVGMLRGELR